MGSMPDSYELALTARFRRHQFVGDERQDRNCGRNKQKPQKGVVAGQGKHGGPQTGSVWHSPPELSSIESIRPATQR